MAADVRSIWSTSRNQKSKGNFQALTEVTISGPAADGRPSPTISWYARGRVSAFADTHHEVPREDDFNRPNSYVKGA